MFKVPKHLSKEFSSLDAEQKEQFIRSYRIWYESDLTQALLKDLTKQVHDSVLKQESKTSFTTLFESKYEQARCSQERATLRKIINQTNPSPEK